MLDYDKDNLKYLLVENINFINEYTSNNKEIEFVSKKVTILITYI